MKMNEIIKARRLELGYTMKEEASAIGVSEGTISRWESGQIKNIPRDKIALLSKFLDIPVPVLMDWEPYEQERIERNKLIRELERIASVAEIRHLRIVLGLLKELEGIE